MARRLYRSKRDCIIGGVAGGLAEYLDVDPTIVRILWVILAFLDGIGVLAYIIAWIIVPPNPSPESGPRFERTESIRNEVIEKAKEVEARLKGDSTAAPEAPDAARAQREPDDRGGSRNEGARVVGLVLVVAGLLLLARNFWSWVDLGTLWPVAIIVAGIALLASGFARRR